VTADSRNAARTSRQCRGRMPATRSPVSIRLRGDRPEPRSIWRLSGRAPGDLTYLLGASPPNDRQRQPRRPEVQTTIITRFLCDAALRPTGDATAFPIAMPLFPSRRLGFAQPAHRARSTGESPREGPAGPFRAASEASAQAPFAQRALTRADAWPARSARRAEDTAARGGTA
jgi:hypothetical protein